MEGKNTPQLTALLDPSRPPSISADAGRKKKKHEPELNRRRTSITILIPSSFNLCRALFDPLCRGDLSRFPLRHQETDLLLYSGRLSTQRKALAFITFPFCLYISPFPLLDAVSVGFVLIFSTAFLPSLDAV